MPQANADTPFGRDQQLSPSSFDHTVPPHVQPAPYKDAAEAARGAPVPGPAVSAPFVVGGGR